MSIKKILISSDVLGRGDDELGELLMSNFFRLLEGSPDKPISLIFWNAGVKLVCEGSWALVHLKKLEEQGVEVLACSTCLEYFDLADKIRVGQPTNMVRSVVTLLQENVVCL
jgi:selenium metabolism protein YedF